MTKKNVMTMAALLVVAGLLMFLLAGVALGSSGDVEQTLVLASGRPLGAINPHDYNSSMAMLDLIYEPLVRYGADGSIQPALAESWDISEGGLTWTFHLRQGVTFHDGTPFDAEAAKWNLDRWIGSDAHTWLPTAARVTSVDTPDSATVVLTLAEPYYASIQDLTLVRPVRFLSPTAVDAAGEFAKPIGTGPWMIESLDDQGAVLVPYAGYWGERPALDKLVVEVIPDPQTRVAALLSGEVHVIGGEYLGGISVESLPTLESNSDIRILKAPAVTTFYIATRFAEPPYDDVRVRQALNHAIDRQGIAAAIFHQTAEPAEGLLPPSIPYVTRTASGAYDYDPERAAALLAEAGWTVNTAGMLEKDGQPLKMNLVVDRSRLPQTESMAEVIQSELKALGIELELRAYDYSGWLDASTNGDYGLTMRFSWGPPYDPHTVLAGAFHTREGEFTSFCNPDLDGLIDSVLATTDDAQRQELYDQIWQLLDDEAAVVPLLYPQRVYALRNEVDGFRLGGTEYDIAYAVQDVVIGAN